MILSISRFHRRDKVIENILIQYYDTSNQRQIISMFHLLLNIIKSKSQNHDHIPLFLPIQIFDAIYRK